MRIALCGNQPFQFENAPSRDRSQRINPLHPFQRSRIQLRCIRVRGDRAWFPCLKHAAEQQTTLSGNTITTPRPLKQRNGQLALER